jgi:hypothetical protein
MKKKVKDCTLTDSRYNNCYKLRIKNLLKEGEE